MGSRTPVLPRRCRQRCSNPLSYDGLRFHTGLAMSAAPLPFGARNSATRCRGPEGPPLPFGPLRPTGRPRPQLCPEASGPVRDPATTARRRSSLRIGRVPLTCLAPLPLSSDCRALHLAVRPPHPSRAYSAWAASKEPCRCTPADPHGTLRPHAALGQAPKPDYHLDFYLGPRSFRVCPLGPFPGLSPQPDPNSPRGETEPGTDGYLLVGSQQFRRL